MSYLPIIFSVLIALIIYKSFELWINIKFGPKVVNPAPKPLIAGLLNELDLLIDMEILGVVEVPLMVKEIPLITDFKEIQLEVINNVINSLSSAFYLEANKCGLKRVYVFTYVTRRTHAKLLEFMQQHNLSLK